jgi:hypothetical protein
MTKTARAHTSSRLGLSTTHHAVHAKIVAAHWAQRILINNHDRQRSNSPLAIRRAMTLSRFPPSTTAEAEATALRYVYLPMMDRSRESAVAVNRAPAPAIA